MLSIFDYFTNSSIIDGLLIYLNTLEVYLSDTVEILREPDQLTAGVLNFHDFQLGLLQIFIGILLFNLLLVFVAWKRYGKEIHDRFIKLCKYIDPTFKPFWRWKLTLFGITSAYKHPLFAASTKEIEELKASVAKLKLPKEHTPRI